MIFQFKIYIKVTTDYNRAVNVAYVIEHLKQILIESLQITAGRSIYTNDHVFTIFENYQSTDIFKIFLNYCDDAVTQLPFHRRKNVDRHAAAPGTWIT